MFIASFEFNHSLQKNYREVQTQTEGLKKRPDLSCEVKSQLIESRRSSSDSLRPGAFSQLSLLLSRQRLRPIRDTPRLQPPRRQHAVHARPPAPSLVEVIALPLASPAAMALLSLVLIVGLFNPKRLRLRTRRQTRD